ncbi:MAG: DUF2330 domain-containing protein [Polyangiaceae bacterium]
MKWTHVVGVGGALSLLFSGARPASACGGCFAAQNENTQVTGHRMILSAGMDHTTLWDQIRYDGAPESFAWVLPIHGTVEVGLSSDALFQVMDQGTAVRIGSPPLCDSTCGTPQSYTTYPGNGAGEFDADSGGGVTVLKQEVVGPYETVQLSAADPAALTDWLVSHGYNIPADIQPVIDQYVAEQMDFLALKLVPGEGVTSMRPVRITTPGAGLGLPLRMVAAGTGEITSIRLYVLGAGRMEPANFPSFTIQPEELWWDWDTQSSNYASLRQSHFEATNHEGWLTDYAGSWPGWLFMSELSYGEGLASYADADGTHAMENLQADIDLLQGQFQDGPLWMTAMSADLSRAALGKDLLINASLEQSQVPNYLFVAPDQTTGVRPEPASPCPPDPCAPGSGAIPIVGGPVPGVPFYPPGEGPSGANGSQGGLKCGVNSGAEGQSAPLWLLGALGITAWARRRRHSKQTVS